MKSCGYDMCSIERRDVVRSEGLRSFLKNCQHEGVRKEESSNLPLPSCLDPATLRLWLCVGQFVVCMVDALVPRRHISTIRWLVLRDASKSGTSKHHLSPALTAHGKAQELLQPTLTICIHESPFFAASY